MKRMMSILNASLVSFAIRNNCYMNLPEGSLLSEDTKQERREKKQQKRRDKIQQHGRSLVRVYKDAVLKRAKEAGKEAKPKGS